MIKYLFYAIYTLLIDILAFIAFLAVIIYLSFDSFVTVNNYICYLVGLPKNIFEVFYFKGIEAVFKYKYILPAVRFLFITSMKGNLGDLPLTLSDSPPLLKENNIFETKLINFADNSNSSSNSNSPSNNDSRSNNDSPSNSTSFVSSTRVYSPFPKNLDKGESLYVSGDERSESPVDFTDTVIPDFVYENNSLNGPAQKQAYSDMLRDRKKFVVEELGFKDYNCQKREVKNFLTDRAIGEVIEMRNRTHTVIFLCDEVSCTFREIHLDSYTQSYPDNRVMILFPNPLLVDKILVDSLVRDNSNISHEELETIRANESEARRIKSQEVEERREGFFQYFFEVKQDFNRLGMLHESKDYDGKDRTFMILDRPQLEPGSKQEELYITALEAYKREFSNRKLLSTMEQHSLSQSSFICKEIRESLQKDIKKCSITKNMALQRLYESRKSG